jgi:2-polyprenyl-6-methoxyphenol hydroxylase-like FAD-dependent oxidoreductase
MPVLGKVLIVGGGISGMTLAIGLKRASIHPEIVEINPRWSVLGMGISLQGPALRALRAVGVLDQCVVRGFGYSYFKACDANGTVTNTLELPCLNGPDYPASIGIMRQALHSVLMEALVEVEVPARVGVTVSQIKQDADSVGVRFTDGTHRKYDLVVGADGANSIIRDMVFGSEWRPKYTGQAVWRATVSRPPEVKVRCSFFGPRNKAGVNPVSDAQMYIYLVQNVPEFVRIPDNRLPAAMREQLADFRGLLATARDEITDPQQIAYRPINSHILPSPWYRGRVILIGDAAHTTTPHMAAGAGIAIEDSIVLALLLQSERPLSGVFEKFMTHRFERCRMVVENSFLLGEWEKNPNAPNVDPMGVLDKSLRALAQPF